MRETGSAFLKLVLLAAVVGLWFSPAVDAQSRTDKKIVLCTIPPVYTLVSALGQGVFEAKQLVPSGTSPHDYQPAPADVRQIARADVVVLNGLGLDDWLLRLLKSAQADGKSPFTLRLSDELQASLIELPALDHDHGDQDHHHHGTHDPHFWLDPLMLAQAATNLTVQLAKTFPEASSQLLANRDQAVQRLQELDRQLETTLAPVRERPFLTQHNGFAYFVRRYRLNLAGVLESTPEVSPSAKELSELLRSARTKKVLAVFSDDSSSQRLADQVAGDLKIKKAALNTLETMSGGLENYATAMNRNASALANLLKD